MLISGSGNLLPPTEVVAISKIPQLDWDGTKTIIGLTKGNGNLAIAQRVVGGTPAIEPCAAAKKPKCEEGKCQELSNGHGGTATNRK